MNSGNEGCGRVKDLYQGSRQDRDVYIAARKRIYNKQQKFNISNKESLWKDNGENREVETDRKSVKAETNFSNGQGFFSLLDKLCH